MSMERKKRAKSARYPAVSLSECIDFIALIDSTGEKTVLYATICELMGLKSVTTRSFLARISASKQFGFLTTSAGTCQLTDSARLFLETDYEPERKRVIYDAFSSPPLYSRLIRRFNSQILPDAEELADLLAKEFKILEQVKELAAECFLESAEYAGAVINGVLRYGGEKHEEGAALPPINVRALKAMPGRPSEQPNGFSFSIPTLNGKSATIFIPEGVTASDLDLIRLSIENMLPVFLENLKRTLPK